MTRLDPETVDFYTYEVVKMIVEKYNMNEMDAYLDFVKSETHALVENVDMGMTQFGAPAILDIWESEKITGDPRNSIYMRCC
ncbi:MAG: hypothetical protein LUD47_08025 [Clostridia bacterium]|nr:hypothetical protein [Clostridia bacterium]